MQGATGGIARAAIEDDFHHFRVEIRHDGVRITGTNAEAPRPPFSLCGAAGERLKQLIGMPLADDVILAAQGIEQRLQCTHQFDTALLAITAAARKTTFRTYEAVIPDDWLKSTDRIKTALLKRDDAQILNWRLESDVIIFPPAFAGISIGVGFSDYLSRQANKEIAEAAFILRRAIFISSGRAINLDDRHVPPDNNGCWAQQPERRLLGIRNYGSQYDFSTEPDLLTADDELWLAFDE